MKGILSLFKSRGNVPRPLRPNTETKTKTKTLLKNNRAGEKQKETKKQVLSKKSKGFAPENGEGRSDEQVRIIAKNASAQNTGFKWITDAHLTR